MLQNEKTMPGFFLSFEGIDFTGKSTQAQLLKKKLESAGYAVILIREPGGTSISEAVRDILLDKNNLEMHPRTELFLYSAARVQIVEQIIKPALAEGKFVICDRYVDSTTAYQGHGRQLDMHMVRDLNHWATTDLMPHLTVLIDLEPEIAEARREAANLRRDRLEGEARHFYQRIREGYLKIAAREKQRYVIVDGRLEPETLHEEIWRIVQQRLTI